MKSNLLCEPTIGYAIIGCGRIAPNHLIAARENGFNVLWCCDLDLDKAIDFAIRNEIPYYTDKYESLIVNPMIDCVSICTDHRSHTDIAAHFISKKHMIIEKPLSSNLNLAIKFCHQIKSSTKATMVVAQHRYDDIVLFVKSLLHKKTLGRITMVNAELSCYRNKLYYTQSYWRGKKELEGGSTVINQAYHVVDLLVFLFGLPNEVKSYCENYVFADITNTEDSCVSLLKYDGFLCTFSSTNTATKSWATRIKIVGTKGEIEFNIDFPPKIISCNLNTEDYTETIRSLNSLYNNKLQQKVNYYGLSHIKQFENFKNSILEKEQTDVTPEVALSTLKLINMIYNN